MGKLARTVPLWVLIGIGCSPAARDRVHRWFFDVPNEAESSNAEATQSPSESWGLQRSTEIRFASVHPPFMQRECMQCHDAGNRMRPRDDLLDSCKSCHARFFSDEVGHAPVSDGDCAICHNMHRSLKPHLLTQDVATLCTDCHGGPEELSEEAHRGKGVEQCTRCHDPHFGSGNLLKLSKSNMEERG